VTELGAPVASDGGVGSRDAMGSAVLGVGTDLVGVSRMRAALARRPRLAERLFTDAERQVIGRGSSDPARHRSMAARLAAKEAVMKSLSAGIGTVAFRDIEVLGGRGLPPSVTLHGRAKVLADSLGVSQIALSMTHDGDVAAATAIASRRCSCSQS